VPAGQTQILAITRDAVRRLTAARAVDADVCGVSRAAVAAAGRVRFRLAFAPEMPPVPTMVKAVEALGLRLQGQDVPVEMLVIERMPIEQ
jgi:hypothetical protein